MAANLLSNNMSSPSGSTTGNQTVDAADQVSTQVRDQPVAILWDIENCPVPIEVQAEDVATNIRGALQQHPVTRGALKLFSAYGDFSKFPRQKKGLQRTGVDLHEVPRGKDAADKAILVDMFLYFWDNPPPYTILFISGDVDFALALHKLGQRGYTVVLAIPHGVQVSRALSNAGKFVWHWHSIACGDGLVSAKSSLFPSFSSDDSDLPNDEEAVVRKWMPQKRYIVGTSSTQTCTINSTQITPDLPCQRTQGRRLSNQNWVQRPRRSTSSDAETSSEGAERGRYIDTGSHQGCASQPGMPPAAQPLALVANSSERPVVSPGSAPPDLGKQPMQGYVGITSKDGKQKKMLKVRRMSIDGT